MLGQVTRKVAEVLHDEKVLDYFTRLVQRVAPKSYTQAKAEMVVTRAFFENFAGDNVRFIAESQRYPGDHTG